VRRTERNERADVWDNEQGGNPSLVEERYVLATCRRGIERCLEKEERRHLELKQKVDQYWEFPDPEWREDFSWHRRRMDEAQRRMEALQRLYPKPYFGRLDEITQRGQRTFYVGQLADIVDRLPPDLNDYTNLFLVDWRDPRARGFYFGSSADPVPTEVTLIRRFEFDEGDPPDIVEVHDLHGMDAADPFLARHLARYGAERLRNLVALIRKEQAEVVFIPQQDTLVVVSGPAGTGKTVVALQRASHLMMSLKMAPEDVLFLGPPPRCGITWPCSFRN